MWSNNIGTQYYQIFGQINVFTTCLKRWLSPFIVDHKGDAAALDREPASSLTFCCNRRHYELMPWCQAAGWKQNMARNTNTGTIVFLAKLNTENMVWDSVFCQERTLQKLHVEIKCLQRNLGKWCCGGTTSSCFLISFGLHALHCRVLVMQIMQNMQRQEQYYKSH